MSSGACGIKHVGLDVHKERTVAAIAEGGLRGEVRDYGPVETTRRAMYYC